MKHLSQISHDIFAQFYTGSNGARKVNCILDDNSVRFIVFENGKKKFAFIPLIPGTFYAFITMSYIAQAKIGFGMGWGAAYAVGAVLAVAYLAFALWFGGKRAAKLGVK